MTLQYVSVEEAMKRGGLRMVVVGQVPSPWGEAAKSILHIKHIEWVAVRLAYDSEPLKGWTGQRNGPVAIYENERPPLRLGRDRLWRRSCMRPCRQGICLRKAGWRRS